MEYQKCPVCNGNGLVSGGFYSHPGDYPVWSSLNTMEMCRTCDGRGIIIMPSMPSMPISEDPRTTG